MIPIRNFYLLVDALDFIEGRLAESFTLADVARACHCSLSCLQKLFRYASHHALKEYVDKRRMTCAARDLAGSGLTVTEIACKYQYNSPEVFSRAFVRVWGVTPSAFTRCWHFTGIFPRMILTDREGQMMMRKRVDISELYDVLRQRQNTYVLCFDIVGLSPINQISREAGDAAIRECLRRIDAQADLDMPLFRIGGDEFALVTGCDDAEKTEKIARLVLDQNGQAIECAGRRIPLAMRAGAIRLASGQLRFSDLFGHMQGAIGAAREQTRDFALVE